MHEDDPTPNSFEEALRSIAKEVGKSVERMVGQVDLDEFAHTVGVDPAKAREWADTASFWLRAQVENFGDDIAGRPATPDPAGDPSDPRGEPVAAERPAPAADDPLRGAAPHPLDLPTEEQGLALAALDSGRWTLEPGSNRLEAHGEGPRPSDPLNLVRELRARDWISADGTVTLVGHDALRRWLLVTPSS
jgi:hypothetical protein